ncbi:hypothetical protein J5N97_002711 [Dioscorea zingiberensis]|uniref:Uncharacterized protein n=1 Tax=Dioscorea zingiberensis TaxID=325984 RepID=A0A9D5D5B3_9LILI|nr:hypothetical protein J5N97_002711 [Dioscorea zingiberensis]
MQHYIGIRNPKTLIVIKIAISHAIQNPLSTIPMTRILDHRSSCSSTSAHRRLRRFS